MWQSKFGKYLENMSSLYYYCNFNVSLELSKLKIKGKTTGNQPISFSFMSKGYFLVI